MPERLNSGSLGPTAILSNPPANLHTPFDSLLQAYVRDGGVRYRAWAANANNLTRLSKYIEALEDLDPETWSTTEALAFWINLYNAATLKLVLNHYPLKSIREIGGEKESPWNRTVVAVAGESLTLNQIENDIIRPRFGEGRIHFALNCAAIGCPPLAAHAYTGHDLEAQLETVTTATLAKPQWLTITADEIRVTKLFEWYEQDFVDDEGSLRDFLARYRQEDREVLLDEARKIVYMDYNWQLNEVN